MCWPTTQQRGSGSWQAGGHAARLAPTDLRNRLASAARPGATRHRTLPSVGEAAPIIEAAEDSGCVVDGLDLTALMRSSARAVTS
jgi:hypothetical protein